MIYQPIHTTRVQDSNIKTEAYATHQSAVSVGRSTLLIANLYIHTYILKMNYEALLKWY